MNDDQVADELDFQAEKRAAMFEEMATQIRLNKNAKFGGAFLIIPPGDGEPFSSLMLNQEEQGVFWGALKSLVEMAMNALETLARQRGFR
jgi:hypothetical protein